jgi:hypothetical protein
VIGVDQLVGPRLQPVIKLLAFLPVGPIGIAVMSRIRRKDWRSYVGAAVPVVAWAAPVGALVLFNKFTIGHFTGYDSTNESSGFSIDSLVKKWDFAVYQIYVYGLFVFAPLGIAGLVHMWRGSRPTALLLALWALPGTVLYTAYYWGGDLPTIAFLRFLLTLFPPLIIAAMWLLRCTETTEKRSIAPPLAAGVLTAMAASIGLWSSIGELERQHRGNLNLHFSAQRILSHANSSLHRPMIMAESGIFPQLVQYMQYLFDADWYAGDVFAVQTGGGFGVAGMFQQLSTAKANSPVLLQRERLEYMDSMQKGKSDADFVRDQQRLMDQALDRGARVYVVVSPAESARFRRRFITSAYEIIELERWVEPCAVHFPKAGDRNWLALPVWNDDEFTPWRPQPRVMFEVRRVPTTMPTSSPS